MQVRTLLKGQDSQASVGSGFLVDESGLLITNYHVVSQYALEPERYRLRFATTDGLEGPVELIDIDVRHDLALPVASQTPCHSRRLAFPPRLRAPDQGRTHFSMATLATSPSRW